jgi:hypothetical protein
MKRNYTLVFLCVLTISCVCAGCGGQQSSVPSLSSHDIYRDEAPDKSLSKSDDKEPEEHSSSSPFDAYFLTTDQQNIVDSAADQLTKQCMLTKGFNFESGTSVDDSAWADAHSEYSLTWGPTDLANAKKFGYQPAYEDPTAKTTHEKPQQKLKPGYLDALTNANRTGCADRSDAQLGYTDAWFAHIGTYENTRRNADESAYLDSAVKTAISQWSQCMKTSGFSYADPRVAVRSYQAKEGNAPSISEKERNTALADAKCKISTKLMHIVDSTTFQYEKQAVKDNQATFSKIKEMSTTVLKNAQNILMNKKD